MNTADILEKLNRIDRLVEEWQTTGPRPGGIHRTVQEIRESLASPVEDTPATANFVGNRYGNQYVVSKIEDIPVFTQEGVNQARAQLDRATQEAAEATAQAAQMVVERKAKFGLQLVHPDQLRSDGQSINVAAEDAAVSQLHAAIMNLPMDESFSQYRHIADVDPRTAFKEGHKQARHALAELIVSNVTSVTREVAGWVNREEYEAAKWKQQSVNLWLKKHSDREDMPLFE